MAKFIMVTFTETSGAPGCESETEVQRCVEDPDYEEDMGSEEGDEDEEDSEDEDSAGDDCLSPDIPGFIPSSF